MLETEDFVDFTTPSADLGKTRAQDLRAGIEVACRNWELRQDAEQVHPAWARVDDVRMARLLSLFCRLFTLQPPLSQRVRGQWLAGMRELLLECDGDYVRAEKLLHEIHARFLSGEFAFSVFSPYSVTNAAYKVLPEMDAGIVARPVSVRGSAQVEKRSFRFDDWD